MSLPPVDMEIPEPRRPDPDPAEPPAPMAPPPRLAPRPPDTAPQTQWRGRQAMITAIAVLSVAVLVLAGLTVHAHLRADEQRDRYVAEQLVANSQEMALYDGRLARNLAAAAWQLDPNDAAWAALGNALRSPATGIFHGPHGGIQQVAHSPDGSVIATGANDGTVALWDSGTGDAQLLDSRLGFGVEALEFSPDGRFLAAGSFDGEILLWNVETRAATAISSPNSTELLAFDPLVTTLAASGADGVVSIWGLDTGLRTGLFDTGRSVTGLAFGQSGEQVLTVNSDDGLIRAYAAETGEPTAEFEPNAEVVYREVLARQGFTSSTFLTCGDGCAMIQDPTGADPQTWPLPDSSTPAALSWRGDTVVASHPSGGLGVWEATGILTGVLPYAEHIDDIAVSTDGSTVFAAAGGGLQRWDLDRMHRMQPFYGATYLRGVAVTGDGERLVATGLEGTYVWDAEGQGPLVDEYPDRPGLSLAVEPDGPLAAIGADADRTVIEIWDTASGDVVKTLDDDGGPVTSLEFNSDGTLLVAATSGVLHRSHQEEYGVTVWDVASGEPTVRLDWDPGQPVFEMDLSPDGTLIATVDQAGLVQLWSSADGTLVGNLPPESVGGASGVRFLPSGAVAVRTGGGAVVWPLDDPEAAPVTIENGYSAMDLSVAPDGEYLAMYEAYPDREIEYEVPRSRVAIWDVEHGAVAASLPVSGTFVYSAVSPDGRTVFIAHDHAITSFDIGYLREDLYRLVCEQDDEPPSESAWAAYVPEELPYGSFEICPDD